MFKKTKHRLVVLNALVFFILQNTFGALIYLYMHYSLYQQVDNNILEKKNHLLHEKEKMGEEFNQEREENHRLIYLLWDKDHKLKKIIPSNSLTKINTERFLKLLNKEGLQSFSIGSTSYRFINISVSTNKNYASVEKIQVIYNLKREKEMLSHLLM